MSVHKTGNMLGEHDSIHLDHEYELSAWAHYFNASEQRIREAVAAVGDRAVKVREHLQAHSARKPARDAGPSRGTGERPAGA